MRNYILCLIAGGLVSFYWNMFNADRYALIQAKSGDTAIAWRLDKRGGGVNFCRYNDAADEVFCGRVIYPRDW